MKKFIPWLFAVFSIFSMAVVASAATLAGIGGISPGGGGVGASAEDTGSPSEIAAMVEKNNLNSVEATAIAKRAGFAISIDEPMLT